MGNYLSVLIAQTGVLTQARLDTDLRIRAYQLDADLAYALGGGYTRRARRPRRPARPPAPPLTDRPGFRRHERSRYQPARKRLLLLATGAFVLIAIAYGIWWALFGAHFENTDDAYVHGNLVQITPQVPGTIVAIEADDTETVSAGQPLVRLDSADTDVALQQAQAKLAQTVRQVRTYYVQNDALAADVDLRSADIVRAQAELARAQSDVSRRQQLAKSGGVSGEEILHAEAALKSAQSGLAQAKAALAAARKLATNQALTRGTDVAGHRTCSRPSPACAMPGWRNRAPCCPRRSAAWWRAAAPRSASVSPRRRADDRGAAGSGVGGSQLQGRPAAQDAHRPARQDECRPVRHLGDLPRHDRRPGCRHRQRFALLPAQNATGNWIRWCSACPCASRSIPRT